MTIRAVEWEVRAPLSGDVLAIARLLHLGPQHEPYYRAVTPNPDPSARKLIGYWASPEAAEAGVFGEYEHLTGSSLYGGTTERSHARVPQKPPPGPGVSQGKAATPERHGARR